MAAKFFVSEAEARRRVRTSMTKIGVLYGMEETFPPALVDRINAMGVAGVTAEHLKVGGVKMAEPSGYGVIIDRISHDIPFYRSYLKNAVLTGTKVINNPFWWSADDKFFNFALATKLGVAIPPTVLLPHKPHPAGHHRPFHAQSGISVELGRDFRLRRLPRFSQAARWRRLEERLQSAFARGIFRGLRRFRRSLHDLAARRQVSGIFPLLRGGPEEGPRDALRPRPAAPFALRAGQSAARPSRWASGW